MIDAFEQIWFVDFEFQQNGGGHPVPLCLVGREYLTGRLIRIWQDELLALANPPLSMDPDCLYIAYYASAELSCHLALGWPFPTRILDLFVEFSCLTSGKTLPCGRGLLGALSYFGLDAIEVAEKESMRQLAMRGGDYTFDERIALLDYCQTDVDSLQKLLPVMLPHIDLPRALLRGRYMGAAAGIEWAGVPIDTKLLTALKNNREEILNHLIAAVNSKYDVYEGQVFKIKKFAEYLSRHNISWPMLPSGTLALDEKTFKEMSITHPRLLDLAQLRRTVSELKSNKLSVGSDGYNRCLLSCFGTKTGRNNPSTTKFVFGLPAWARCLIKPKPGDAIAYIDYEQQEFGIAAALSGDPTMKDAYRSGDPYLAFAKQAGAVPLNATKSSHGEIREQFKRCILGVQYGMGQESLARSLNLPVARARELLRLHRIAYPVFWEWFEAVLNHAMFNNHIHSVFGWSLHVTSKVNPRTVTNFPMQANGAEILRLACCQMTENDITVCAPVHDAVLIEAPLEQIHEKVMQAEHDMTKASEIVLSGFRLRTEAKIVQYPHRYIDDRGVAMWEIVKKILNDLKLYHDDTG